MNGDPRSVLLAPVVSEKSYGMIGERNKYTFKVHADAHKTQIRQAVEELFDVKVEGVNIVKKHAKPNPLKGTTGGIVEKTMPIHQSNVAIFNAATGKADRVGIKITQGADGKRVAVRVFKSSGDEIKFA